MNQPRTAVTEYDAIAGTIQHYIESARTGRSADMKPAFHPDATIFGYVGPDLFAGPIQKLYDWLDETGPAKEVEIRIASIEVHESVGVARLEIDNWGSYRFTDLFTLLKVDGEWKIMNKVFHLHP